MSASSPTPNTGGSAQPEDWFSRWQRFSAGAVRAFHAYASWLVSISWRRFIVLALGLVVVVAMLHDEPPFTWRVTEQVETPVKPRG